MVLFTNVNGRNCFFVFVDIDKKKISLTTDTEKIRVWTCQEFCLKMLISTVTFWYQQILTCTDILSLDWIFVVANIEFKIVFWVSNSTLLQVLQDTLPFADIDNNYRAIDIGINPGCDKVDKHRAPVSFLHMLHQKRCSITGDICI